MKNPEIGIVIPIIQRKYIIELINKIDNTTYDNNYIICVVNDGNINIKDYLIKYLPNTTELLNLENNLCFAGANNAGWKLLINKYPSIKYLCSINDDTNPHKNWLHFLENCLKNNTNVAVCSPIMITHNGFFINKKQYSSTWKLGDTKHPMVLDKEKIKIDSYVSVLGGFCFLAKVKALLQVDFFDERYKNSSEDIDLCLKLRTNNWDLMVSCNSFVSHKCAKSRFKSKMNTNIPQSRKLLFSKWGNDLNKYNL